MNNREAFELFENLNKPVMKGITGAKCVYAIARTKEILKRELAIFENASDPSPKYVEFDSKRIEVAKKYADKNEQGQPIIKNGEYSIPDDKMPSCIKEIDAIRADYKDAIEGREAQIKSYNELLEKPIAFEIHYISAAELPEQITQEQMDILFPMCKD